MLTTRCPNCGTTFRIRPEQLGVRGGRVRCGSCHMAFSALETLEEVPDEQTPAPSPVPPAAPSALPQTSAKPSPEPVPVSVSVSVSEEASEPGIGSEPSFPVETSASFPPEEVKQEEVHHEPVWLQIDPNLPLGGFLTPETPSVPRQSVPKPLPTIHDAPPLIDPDKLVEPRFSASPVPVYRSEPEPETEEFKIDIRMGRSERKVSPREVEPQVSEPPYRSQIAQELGVMPFEANQDDDHGQTYMLSDSLDEPPPVPVVIDGDESLLDLREKQVKQRKQRKVEDRRRKKSRWPWIVGSLPLALLAMGLVAYLFRTEIGRNLPEARPYLEQACLELGCTVPYPHEPDQIKVEGSNLIAEAPQRSRLVVTLRNKAAYPVAWPSIELTLTDKFDIAIARRVLKSAEWLPADHAKAPAFPAHSEVTANVLIESQQEPSGFRVYAFYP